MAAADESLGDQDSADTSGPGVVLAMASRLDPESRRWIGDLGGTGPVRDEALARLHELLLRIGRAEIGRRRGRHPITGPELDDLAHQAAADALVAITAKLAQFRGESRFSTWAYRFVVLEVSAKLGGHFWQRPTASMDEADWERLPDRFAIAPEDHAQGRELITEMRRAVSEQLTAHQRQVFIALVVDGVPLDALVVRLGTTRNAIYKTMFDARRKLRAALVASGYLGDRETSRESRAREHDGATMSGWAQLDQFLRTDPRDVGCSEALRLLHVYVDLVLDSSRTEAARRYPGIEAHLQACGPCGDDFDGLLLAVRTTVARETNLDERR